MKQTFGIVDNGTVRDMTPEEIEHYSSLYDENGIEINATSSSVEPATRS